MDQRKSISVGNYFIINGMPTHSIAYMMIATFTTRSILGFLIIVYYLSEQLMEKLN